MQYQFGMQEECLYINPNPNPNPIPNPNPNPIPNLTPTLTNQQVNEEQLEYAVSVWNAGGMFGSLDNVAVMSPSHYSNGENPEDRKVGLKYGGLTKNLGSKRLNKRRNSNESDAMKAYHASKRREDFMKVYICV